MLLWFLFLVVSSVSASPNEYVELPSSCVGQADGYQWLKPLDGAEFPPIYQMCSNEYLMIDVSRDANVQKYFSSWDTYHYAIAGPELMDFATWEQWWTPNALFLDSAESESKNQFYSYIISPQCDVCDLRANSELNPFFVSSDDNSTHASRTAYHMTGTMFTCQTDTKALKDCRMDYDTYECYYCALSGLGNTTWPSDGDLGYTVFAADDETFTEILERQTWGVGNLNIVSISLCGVYPQSARGFNVPQSKEDCLRTFFNSKRTNTKPSIGTDGRFCQCTKPNAAAVTSSNRVSLAELRSALNALAEIESRNAAKQAMIDDNEAVSAEESASVSVELYQRDFESGTYRITKSGTYVVMEDIIFDFNAGDVEDPNAEWAWWPLPEQSDEYNGAGSTRDEYFMGFFAGITVEADDVVLDLNGYEIAQSRAFYYQQRFFACVALKSVVFPLNQGPGLFGAEPVFASRVTIQNGAIGLSSHFGIHGHNNDDVRIENVHIHSFETHGVEMSYFSNLEMYNVEIGPSSMVAFLKGEYGYGRWLLQKLELMSADPSQYTRRFGVDTFPFAFDGRSDQIESIDDLHENLRELMDIAFKSVMGIEDYDESDARFLEAKSLFINDDGLPYGAAMYGLFLNLFVSNVFTIHPSLKHSDGAQIKDLYIHDLHHKTDEYVRLDGGAFAYKNPFDAGLDAEALLGDQLFDNAYELMDWSKVHYRGTALTDVTIALNMVSDHWGISGFSRITEELWKWSIGRYTYDDADDTPYLGCNNDRMTHVPKGIMAIRMDGIENVAFENLEIENLHEHADLGSDVCGEYWDEDFRMFTGQGHFLQNAPYLYGYTGNMVHGLFSDWAGVRLTGQVSIHGLNSRTGLVRAVGMYINTSLDIGEVASLAIYDLRAGSDLWQMDTSAFARPYAPAIAKAFHILNSYTDDYNHTFYSTLIGDPAMVGASCVFGVDGIDDDWDAWSLELELGSNIDDAGCTQFERSDTLSREVSLSSAGQSAQWLLIVMLIGAFACAALSIYTLCGQRKSLLVADGEGKHYGSF